MILKGAAAVCKLVLHDMDLASNAASNMYSSKQDGELALKKVDKWLLQECCDCCRLGSLFHKFDCCTSIELYSPVGIDFVR